MVTTTAPPDAATPGSLYGGDLAAIHAAGFEAMAVAAAGVLGAHMGPDRMRVLDLGCGAGPLSAAMAAAGHEVWGIDASPALIAFARAKLPGASFEVGDLLTAALPPAGAAAAVGEVLNYATATGGEPALEAILARIRAALPRGGAFLFDCAGPGRHGDGARVWSDGPGGFVAMAAEVNGRDLTRRIVTFRAKGDGWHRGEEVHRLRLWSEADIYASAETAGFAVKALRAYGDMALPPGLTAFTARAV